MSGMASRVMVCVFMVSCMANAMAAHLSAAPDPALRLRGMLVNGGCDPTRDSRMSPSLEAIEAGPDHKAGGTCGASGVVFRTRYEKVSTLGQVRDGRLVIVSYL